MPNESLAEIYFVGGMMIIILIISFSATYLFVRQYKREKSKNLNEEKDKSTDNEQNSENE